MRTKNEHSLVALLHIVELQRHRLDALLHGQVRDYQFELQALDVNLLCSKISVVMIDTLNMVSLTPGLGIRQLQFNDLDESCLDRSFASCRSLLWRWVAAATGVPNDLTVYSDDVAQASGVQFSGAHSVSCRSLSKTTLIPLLSSIMCSNNVHELALEKPHFSSDPGLTEIMWYWLFYTLFNEAASHSVRSLSIEANDILLEDMLLVRGFVRSPWPIDKLLDPEYDKLPVAPLTAHRASERPAQVVLKSNARILLDSRQCPSRPSTRREATTFDVMHERSDGFDILVPGYGQCWVKHEDVTSQISPAKENARNRWRLKTHSITKVSLSVSYDSRRFAILALMCFWSLSARQSRISRSEACILRSSPRPISTLSEPKRAARARWLHIADAITPQRPARWNQRQAQTRKASVQIKVVPFSDIEDVFVVKDGPPGLQKRRKRRVLVTHLIHLPTEGGNRKTHERNTVIGSNSILFN